MCRIYSPIRSRPWFYARAGWLLFSVLVLPGVREANAQTPSAWKFWSTGDGLQEAFTSGVAVDSTGVVFAKHGAVDKLSRLTGYSVDSIPDPGIIGRVAIGADHDLWVFGGNKLFRYHGSRWTSYLVPDLSARLPFITNDEQYWIPPPGAGDQLYKAAVCPVGKGRVLLLLPDRLLEFDANSGRFRTVEVAAETSLKRFIGMYRTTGKRIWVSGQNGVANVLEMADGVGLQWRDYPAPAGFRDFEQPREGDGGELFVAASLLTAKVLVRFDGNSWTPIYKGGSARLRAWRGADHDLWVQDDNAILRLSESQGAGTPDKTRTGEPVDRQAALSGRILDVVPDSGGAFWVTTTQGIARYTPASWRTPAAVRGPEMDLVVHAITEDQSGNVWFLSTKFLIRFGTTGWSKYSLPVGDRPGSSLTDALRILPDGRVALLSLVPGELLLFDPVRKRFESVRHPEGRILRTFLPRRNGSFFIQSVLLDDRKTFRLETFDGKTFHTYLDLNISWPGSDDLRALCETAEGDLWLGSTSGLGLYSRGKYRSVGPAHGFRESAAFSVFELSPGKVLVGGRSEILKFDGHRWTSVRKGADRVRNMIRARDGTVWAASGSGLDRFQNDSWFGNEADEGLPSSVVYKVFQDSRGRVWAGTTRGISLFHPDAATESPHTTIDEGNSTQAAPETPVRLMFSGVDKWKLTPPERLLSSYRMDKGKWSEYANPDSATFQRLEAGTHHFEVRAMDRNGNVDSKPAYFDFTVMVPWYKSFGFQIVGALAVGVIALLLFTAGRSYRYRGKLLLEVQAVRRLDEGRKEILELIAKRASLETILRRVAELLEANQPGSGYLIALSADNEQTAVASAGLPDQFFSSVSGRRTGHQSGPVGGAPSAGEILGSRRVSIDPRWNSLERAVLASHFSTCSTIPIVSGVGSVLGAIEVFWPGGHHIPAACHFDVVVGLAASAIENAQLYQELAYRAQYDSLTRLPNRLYFGDRLQETIGRARRSGHKVALLYLDLDRFKQVNDSLGHGVGDEFLLQVSRRLSGCLTSTNFIARMGGDEFMVLLDGVRDTKVVEEAAKCLLEALKRPLLVAGNELFASASIGISLYPGDGEDASTLQKNADIAMYRAKQQGKNGYEYFAREMNTAATHRLDAERCIRHALDQGYFELHYQPQLTFGGEVTGIEALIRLRHPERGLLRPGDFIPAAEESGLILDIGTWVLKEACRQRLQWDKQGYKPPKIAINVSALQFARADFAQTVAQTLRENHLPGNALELELTESVVMVHMEESIRQMEKLRTLGCTIALDDFGTGYSSLSSLYRLPIDVLKIDLSFVRDIDTPSGTLAIVHSIVDLAHNLGLSSVGEGVERKAQYECLREIGCDIAQGHLLSPPLLAGEMEHFLAAKNEFVLELNPH